MTEYRLNGLSCADCTDKLEKEIRGLKNGAETKIFYNTAKLILPDGVSLPEVEKILKTENVSLIQPEKEGGDHDHSHDNGNDKRLLIQLGVSTVILIAALIFGDKMSAPIAFFVFLIAAGLSGYQTFLKGLKNLVSFKFNIDTLMTVALVGAFAIGDYKEGTVVAILFGVNEYLEGFGMRQARKSMAELLKVAPKTANVIQNGETKQIPIADLRVNDIVLIRAGEKVPSDAVLIEGSGSFDEAAITGESMPVEKQVGDDLFGGSINNEGTIRAQITALYKDSSLAKILHLVEEAQETKTPTELFIDKFARYYTPVIMIFAVMIAFVPPLFFGGDYSKWIYEGLAVLIIGCPCALILASPVTIVSGITRSAKNGVLIKGGVFLEQLSKIKQIAFDKTGTLTKGKPAVADMYSYDDKNFLDIVGRMESDSLHPIAGAIMREIESTGKKVQKMDSLQTVAGKGLVGNLDGVTYFMGSESQIPEKAWNDTARRDAASLKQSGFTLVVTSTEDRILGMFGIRDALRPESRELIGNLHALGVNNTIMLTGDHAKTAEKVAAEIGIDSYYADLLPEEKLTQIQKIQAESGKVMMVGDGINDSPALATADLGIAMGKGTDSAIEVADVVLMQDHLQKLPITIKIAKRVHKIVTFNIAFALGLKIIALLLTLPGILTLWMAIMADMGATVVVTLLGLTILIRSKEEKQS
ncbi:ATPase P [Listeria floridensis FSL S10-1187]|uniref:Cd(2+)-exporting ATPase n=1 Tax=Listeria floridensis FSL S10-1187 TaxID=1265817 RepID=A0ABN0RBJ9_9LIST|nr:cation-translocating P-type ATPase [Listeria floridensis]EUJ25587.1 ATPase P [Listeria floridensis FSL S10-1187]